MSTRDPNRLSASRSRTEALRKGVGTALRSVALLLLVTVTTVAIAGLPSVDARTEAGASAHTARQEADPLQARKKILVTGFTAIQCGRLDRREICSFPAMITRALDDLGHDVEHRPTVPEEPLGGFDQVWVGIASPISRTSRHAPTAMDVIARARVEGCQLGFIVDDWALRKIHTNFGCVVKNPAMLARENAFGSRPQFAWGVKHLDFFGWVSEHIQHTTWPTTLVPTFTWGDPSILVERTTGLKSHEFLFVDPSAYAPEHMVPLSAARERRWISGALTSNPRWLHRQGFAWPVTEYGHCNQGQENLKEAELVARYGAARGVVASPYYHAGSGWWRVRYVHAARAGAVLYADPEEVVGLGPAYKHPLAQLEAMSDDELTQVAEEQAADLLARQWSRERFMTTLDAVVRGNLKAQEYLSERFENGLGRRAEWPAVGVDVAASGS